jgi:hypothetical protein
MPLVSGVLGRRNHETEEVCMRTREKLLLSALAIGLLGSLTTFGVFGLFSATTSNAGNEFNTGSVTISDNDLGSALYSVPNAEPGDTVTRCIKVLYSGTLDGDVDLYMSTPVAAVGAYVDVTITPGTQTSSTFPDCTGFTPQAGGAIYSGSLLNLAEVNNNFTTGLQSAPAGKTQWSTNDSVVYKFQVTLNVNTPSAAEAQSTGDHTFTWEARTD